MCECLIKHLKKIEAVAHELGKKIQASNNETVEYLIICRQKGVYDAFYAIQEDELKLPINPPV